MHKNSDEFWLVDVTSCAMYSIWVEDFTPVLGESNHPWRKPKRKKAEKNSSSLNFSCFWFKMVQVDPVEGVIFMQFA